MLMTHFGFADFGGAAPGAGFGVFGFGFDFSLRCCLLATCSLLFGQLLLFEGRRLLTDDLEERGSWANNASSHERGAEGVSQVA
jgi:hypothetical protein